MQFGELPISFKRGKITKPVLSLLEKAPKIGTNMPPGWINLIVSCEDAEKDGFVDEINQWLRDSDCDCGRVHMFGIYGYEVHSFRVDCEFRGVAMYFVDYMDAIHLKLAMADRCNF